MKSLLKQLYDGELYPLENVEPRIEEYNQKFKEIYNRRSDFYDKLNDKLQDEYDCIVDDFYELFSMETTQTFVQGFSLGARMMIEVYNVKE